jgi:hypothetical protein
MKPLPVVKGKKIKFFGKCIAPKRYKSFKEAKAHDPSWYKSALFENLVEVVIMTDIK